MKQLKQRFSYRKFAGPTYKILYLDDDYFLQRSSIEALKKLGHKVEVLRVEQNPTYMLEAILKQAVYFQPDCIMSVNHAGFDEDGKIAAILADLRLPVLQWYLDDFRFITLDAPVHANAHTAIFTFERQHIAGLQAGGYTHVHYLPSAAAVDPEGQYGHKDYGQYARSTVFIGSTFRASKKKRSLPRYPNLARQLERKVDLTLLQHRLVDDIAKHQGHHFQTAHDRYHYASYAICHATEIYRRNSLKQVNSADFHVFGDNAWQNTGIKGEIHPPVDNKRVAPFIQHQSLVNLCLSSQQLGSAVSLRAYDIPASGGFLLTDWKEDLATLFAEDEVVSFRSVAEMNDKISYYEAHPQKREPIIRKARDRVHREHQVIHRMRKLLSVAVDIDW